MLDPYCTHKKGMMGVGMGLRTPCVGDEEVPSGTVGLCDACMCTGLNQQLYQERFIRSFAVAQSGWGREGPFLLTAG